MPSIWPTASRTSPGVTHRWARRALRGVSWAYASRLRMDDQWLPHVTTDVGDMAVHGQRVMTNAFPPASMASTSLVNASTATVLLGGQLLSTHHG